VAPVVRIGVAASPYDVPFHLAVSRGYFVGLGLDAELVRLSNADALLAAVIAGQLDAAAVAPSAALFDALARPWGAPRIVATAGQALPGHSPAAVLLRPTLSPPPALDLRGRLVGAELYGPGGRNMALALARLGLTPDDVQLVDLPPEAALQALAAGQLDAAYGVEPLATALVVQGRAVRWLGVDVLEPGQELAVLLFSPNLLAHRRTVAIRLLAAYRQAQETYRAAVRTAAGREALAGELARALGIADPAVTARLSPVGYPPDGAPNVASLAAIQEHFQQAGLLERPADLTAALDLNLLAAAEAYRQP